MAFLLRLRTTIHTLKTPYLLHYHRHLSSAAAADHPNSNLPSPSLLRELREAIKQLSATGYVIHSKTPTCTVFRFVISSTPNQSHHQNAAPSSANPSSALDAKFEQLKATTLTLARRQTNDRQRLWNLRNSRIDFRDEIVRNIANHVRTVEELKNRRRGAALSRQKRETLVEEINGLISELKKLKDMTVEAVDLVQVLLDSRLDSLDEIIEKLSEMKNELQEEVWDELNEGLMKGRDAEEKEAMVLVLEIKQQLDSLIPVAENLSELGHSYM